MALSSLGKKIKHLIILTDGHWPSWTYVLDLFLESSIVFKKATILAPSRSCHNFFGLSRTSAITWDILELVKPLSTHCHNKLLALVSTSGLLLYSGTLPGFHNLMISLDHLASTSFRLLAIIHGQVRLRKLRRYSLLTWRLIKHSDVGSATSGKFWIGYTQDLRSESIPPPTSCPLAMMDLLEFAPKGISVDESKPPPSTSRLAATHPALSPVSAWYCNGLFPHHMMNKQPLVVTPSPFVPSKWCSRILTAREYTRLFDIPVAIESRVAKCIPSSLPTDHPIRNSVPGKLLTHALWLAGFCSVHGEGIGLQRPIFTVDNTTGYIVSQEQFNKASGNVDVKAAKMDDAAVPVVIWNNRLLETYPDQKVVRKQSRQKLDDALDILRTFMLKIWKRKVRSSFIHYLNKTWPNYQDVRNQLKILNNNTEVIDEMYKDLEAGRDCIMYSTKCNWWEWLGGSRLFFWRWPLEFRIYARDGIPICWLPNKEPTSKRPQPPVHDALVKEQMTKKLNKVRNRGYVRSGYVRSLIRFFAVPKGNADIRMVYDGTASGFNDSVYVPNFGLPTIETLLRGTDPDTWMVDLDIGDMFLNFMLAEDARELVGVDITPFVEDELDGESLRTKWERWWRVAMGLKVSPNHAIRAVLFAEEFMKGDLTIPSNPFQTSTARLNLPGTKTYVPSMAWFSLIDREGNLSSILVIYVDDERVQASTENKAWLASHQVAARESYLGIQDAARKRRPPSQSPGAWAGSIIRTNNSEVGKLISKE